MGLHDGQHLATMAVTATDAAWAAVRVAAQQAAEAHRANDIAAASLAEAHRASMASGWSAAANALVAFVALFVASLGWLFPPSRPRFSSNYNLISGGEGTSSIRITNVGATTQALEYWTMVWRPRWRWGERYETTAEMPDELFNIVTIKPHSSYHFPLESHGTKGWRVAEEAKKRLVLRLYLAGGRRPKDIVVYP